MNKILVVSDTHGNSEGLKQLINSNNYDYIFFLGDLICDTENIKHKNFFKVKGNWDYFSTEKLCEFVEIENYKFFLTHGHKFSVKVNLNKLLQKAKEENANVVCFGHTHKQFFEKIDDVLVINPGAFSNFKGGNFGYCEILLNNDKISVNMLNNLK